MLRDENPSRPSGQPEFLPTPAATWKAGLEMARSGELLTDTLASVRRVVLGFGLALAISVPLGFAMGTWRWAVALLEPVIGLVRYMPASAFIPLLIWIDLPAERTLGTRRTPEFLALRTEVEDLVRAQHVRVGQAESSGVAASTTMG